MRRVIATVFVILIAAVAAYAAAMAAGRLLNAIGFYERWAALAAICIFFAVFIFIMVDRR